MQWVGDGLIRAFGRAMAVGSERRAAWLNHECVVAGAA